MTTDAGANEQLCPNALQPDSTRVFWKADPTCCDAVAGALDNEEALPRSPGRCGLTACKQTPLVPPSHYDRLADQPYIESYPLKADIGTLKQELLFERGVQAYLWALPALNMYGMKEGSEKVFGKGYNILPIFKERLNAKTLITTPNSDVIYALGYLDLKEDGPLVIEVPPGLQGILDDFWQRPIRSEGQIDGRDWAGDVGLPGPDHGKGGKYLILPPDYKGPIPIRVFHLPLRHLWSLCLLARLLQGSETAALSRSR